MAKYQFSVGTKYIGSEVSEEVEVPDEELEGMSEDEIEDYVYEEYFQDWLENNIDYDFTPND